MSLSGVKAPYGYRTLRTHHPGSLRFQERGPLSPTTSGEVSEKQGAQNWPTPPASASSPHSRAQRAPASCSLSGVLLRCGAELGQKQLVDHLNATPAEDPRGLLWPVSPTGISSQTRLSAKDTSERTSRDTAPPPGAVRPAYPRSGTGLEEETFLGLECLCPQGRVPSDKEHLSCVPTFKARSGLSSLTRAIKQSGLLQTRQH